MDENWRKKPHGGESRIRCQAGDRYDGLRRMAVFGRLAGQRGGRARINDGSMDSQGLNLTGADSLTFWARYERGGERAEGAAYTALM